MNNKIKSSLTKKKQIKNKRSNLNNVSDHIDEKIDLTHKCPVHHFEIGDET